MYSAPSHHRAFARAVPSAWVTAPPPTYSSHFHSNISSSNEPSVTPAPGRASVKFSDLKLITCESMCSFAPRLPQDLLPSLRVVNCPSGPCLPGSQWLPGAEHRVAHTAETSKGSYGGMNESLAPPEAAVSAWSYGNVDALRRNINKPFVTDSPGFLCPATTLQAPSGALVQHRPPELSAVTCDGSILDPRWPRCQPRDPRGC